MDSWDPWPEEIVYKSIDSTEEDDSISRTIEASMESHVERQSFQPIRFIAPADACAHDRLIDDVLTRSGNRTGRVRCLECGEIFDDPYKGLK
jgi:hypothetical protein